MDFAPLTDKLLASGFKEVKSAKEDEQLYARGDLQVCIRPQSKDVFVLYPQLGDLARLLKIPGEWLIAKGGVVKSSHRILEKAIENFMTIVETYPATWTGFALREIEKAFADK